MVNAFDLIFGSQILPPFLYVRYFWEIFFEQVFCAVVFLIKILLAPYVGQHYLVTIILQFLTLMASRAQWTQHSACGLHVMTVNVGSMLTVMTLGCLVLITLQILTGYVMIVCN